MSSTLNKKFLSFYNTYKRDFEHLESKDKSRNHKEKSKYESNYFDLEDKDHSPLRKYRSPSHDRHRTDDRKRRKRSRSRSRSNSR